MITKYALFWRAFVTLYRVVLVCICSCLIEMGHSIPGIQSIAFYEWATYIADTSRIPELPTKYVWHFGFKYYIYISANTVCCVMLCNVTYIKLRHDNEHITRKHWPDTLEYIKRGCCLKPIWFEGGWVAMIV